MEQRNAEAGLSPRASDRPNVSRPATERQIERLVGEIGNLIQSAEPQSREDLKEFAETLLHQETTISDPTHAGQQDSVQSRRRQNPLAAGLLLLLLAGGVTLISIGIGLMLACIALGLIVWGGIMSSVRK